VARNFFIDDENTSPPHLQSNSGGHAGTNADLTATACPDCEGYPALCVSTDSEDVYAFYSIAGEQ
jgi:hypothetical protein